MKYLTQMEETARQLPQDVLEAGRKVWFAGVGAVGMISNTTSTLFDTLVDEGKRFQKTELDAVDRLVTKTSKTVNTVVGDATTYVQDAATRVENNVQQVTKAALNRLGMPSRRDVSELSSRVETLTAKLEALGKKGTAHVTN